jgi:hypothetical protein
MPEEIPNARADSFTCPHCRVYSEQKWHHLQSNLGSGGTDQIGSVGRCTSCGGYTIWIDGEMYYPKASTAPHAHEEMPDDVRRDFDEARLVLDDSPRAAAALLRLAIQRLMENHLGAEGYSLNDQIGNLVEDGDISPRLQRALDAVRVIGNNSVHPGEMNMDDNRETAGALFMLLNEIVDEAIARDIRIDDVYESLPDDYLEGIENRDGE